MLTHNSLTIVVDGVSTRKWLIALVASPLVVCVNIVALRFAVIIIFSPHHLGNFGASLALDKMFALSLRCWTIRVVAIVVVVYELVGRYEVL